MLQTIHDEMDSPKQNETLALFGCLMEQNDKSLNWTANVSLDVNSNITTCGDASLAPKAAQPRQKGIITYLV